VNQPQRSTLLLVSRLLGKKFADAPRSALHHQRGVIGFEIGRLRICRNAGCEAVAFPQFRASA
jgi:hypothetical protein